MEIVETKWFSALNTVGIVLTKNEFGHKAFIGTGMGLSEDSDAVGIAAHGSWFYYGPLVWPSIKGWRE